MLTSARLPLSIAIIVALEFTLSACKSIDKSLLLHQEGDFGSPAPGFFWHSISSPEDLQIFEKSSGASTNLRLKSTPMVRRLQEIIDELDAAARSVRGEELSKIPRPKIYVTAQDEVSAFVRGIQVCVTQKVLKRINASASQATKSKGHFSIFGQSFSPTSSVSSDSHEDKSGSIPPTPDSTAPQVESESSSNSSEESQSSSSRPSTTSSRSDQQSSQMAPVKRIILLSSPGKAIAGKEDVEGEDDCATVDPADIDWDPQAFVSQWNKKATKIKETCAIEYKDGAIVVPDDRDCGHFITGKQYDIVQFPAHANIITVTSAAITHFDERALTWVLAHELGHYYRGHSSQITALESFYFDQSSENELRQPTETKAHQGLRAALEAVRMIRSVEQPQGVRIEANLMVYSIALTKELLVPYCNRIAKTSSCQEAIAAMTLLFDDPDYEKHLTAAAGYVEMSDRALAFVSEYEEIFYRMMDEVQIAKIPYDLAVGISRGIPDGFVSFAELKLKPSSFRSWFDNFGKNVRANIPQIKPLYMNAMKLGLGYYTDEEEADEIGQEMAARVGLRLADMEEAIWDLGADGESKNVIDQDTELSLDACKKLAKNDWRNVDGQPVEAVLLGPVSNSHHSLCYRLFNLQREWKAHNYEREDFPKTPMVFDAKKWRQMLSDTNQQAAALIASSNSSSSSIPVERSQDSTLSVGTKSLIGQGLPQKYEDKLREVRARMQSPACRIFADPLDL